VTSSDGARALTRDAAVADAARMEYVLGGVAGVVLLVVAFVVYVRASAARADRRLEDDVRAYVAKKGGKVTFEGDAMVVEGPRGSGREGLAALRIMLGSAKDRELSIGFVLRKYFPDRFDDLFEENAQKRLAAESAAIAALPPDELRARLRVRIVSERASKTGLWTAARGVAEGLDARVVLDGFDLDGLPVAARATLPEDDDALFAAALRQTLGAPPSFEAGQATGHAWLASPRALFGERAVIVAGVGPGLAWFAAEPGGAEAALLGLAEASRADGPLKSVLFGWDGASLSKMVVVAHTIKGPDTPDYTLQVPPAFAARLGLPLDATGSVALRR